jgi:hypothetical protein
MAQHALDTGIADTDLQEGQQSLALILQVNSVPAFAMPASQIARPALLFEAPKVGNTEYQPLTALAGILFKLHLPPPRQEALWQPPRLHSPSLRLPALLARAPPVRF